MCQSAVSLTQTALHEVDNAEALLKIKGVVALFIQTMNVRHCSPMEPLQVISTDNLSRGTTLLGYLITFYCICSRSMPNFSNADLVTTFKRYLWLFGIRSLP